VPEGGARAEALADQLAGLDIATGMELIVARPRMGAADDPRWKGALIDLVDLSTAAHASSAARSGPAGDIAIDRAALRLAVLFEQVAGRPATHSPYDNLEYRGEPMSAAGRFVRAVFRIVDPAVTPQRIGTALDRAVRELKRS